MFTRAFSRDSWCDTNINVVFITQRFLLNLMNKRSACLQARNFNSFEKYHVYFADRVI